METKPWQIPYPMENWKMRYMVVWIQNHDMISGNHKTYIEGQKMQWPRKKQQQHY
jgi:hypothetical protein